jgi:hypothetical protein
MRRTLVFLLAAAAFAISTTAMAQSSNDPCWVAALEKYPEPQHAQTGGSSNAGQLALWRQSSYDACSKGRQGKKNKPELSAAGKARFAEQKCRKDAVAKYPDSVHAQTGGSQAATQLADLRQKFTDLCLAESKF